MFFLFCFFFVLQLDKDKVATLIDQYLRPNNPNVINGPMSPVTVTSGWCSQLQCPSKCHLWDSMPPPPPTTPPPPPPPPILTFYWGPSTASLTQYYRHHCTATTSQSQRYGLSNVSLGQQTCKSDQTCN